MSTEKLPIIPKNTVVNLQADRFAVGGQEISFLEDSDFVNAWNEVMDEIKPKVDIDNIKKGFWRAHVVNTLFVNSYRPGCCYVECGTNLGIMSRMVFKLNREKSFKKYLFDTWQGIPESQFSDDEPLGTWHNNHSYNEDLFDFIEPLNAEFQDITFVRGEIPETLSQTYANISPSFLHIDMNIEYPERKALQFFVPQMKPGSVVLLDDYGFARHSKQRHSQDNFFRRLGKQPTQMPTGQAFVLL